jgi:hypothetical protein
MAGTATVTGVTVPAIQTSDYYPSPGEFVRVSGSANVYLPGSAEPGVEIMIRQTGIGTVTVVGNVNGTTGGRLVTGAHHGIVLTYVGSGAWSVKASAQNAGQFPGAFTAVQPSLDSGPAGAYRANGLRADSASNLAALSTGVMTSVLLYLEAGDVVTSLTFVSGTTAAGTPTHWWFGLYSTATTPALLAQTADQTSTAWAANTAQTVALTAPYTVPATGLYYASIMVTATTPPSLLGSTVGHCDRAEDPRPDVRVVARGDRPGDDRDTDRRVDRPPRHRHLSQERGTSWPATARRSCPRPPRPLAPRPGPR